MNIQLKRIMYIFVTKRIKTNFKVLYSKIKQGKMDKIKAIIKKPYGSNTYIYIF